MLNLDFSEITSIEGANAKVEALADDLLNKWDIQLTRVGNARLKISILEFYIYDPRYCPDESTHKSKEQLEAEYWYVHKNGSRSLNRTGIDITAGSSRPDVYAGVLIRGIEGRDGPARALHTMLRGSTYKYNWCWYDTEREYLFDEVQGKNIFYSPIRLVPASPIRCERLFREALWAAEKYRAGAS